MIAAIAAILAWGWANPAYGLAVLVGLALGIFYGFDGWWGDTANLDFKDSPRAKNMLWVLGGAVTAFFGDVKALDPDAKRAPLLLAYFAAWLAAAIVVVVFWGLVVWISRLVASIRGRNYGYGALDAVSDYFFYGYRHYRAQAQAAQSNQAARFHNAYVEQLTLTITAIGSVTDANRLAIARSILGAIAAVIKSYHRDETDTKGIRANVMLMRPCDDALRARLRFIVAANRAQIARCLELITYDVPENQPGIVLPIADDLDTALPGAPTAFLHPDRFAVIDDTLQVAFAPGVPQAVQTEINAYFKGKVFRSFGSIQMVGRAGTIGVVNLEASIKQVFGQSDDERRQLIRYLLPFCAALAIVYSHP